MDDLAKRFLGMAAISAVTLGAGFVWGRLSQTAPKALAQARTGPTTIVFPIDTPGHYYILKARVRNQDHIVGHYVDDLMAEKLRDMAKTWSRTSAGGFYLTFADGSSGDLVPETRFSAPKQIGGLYKVKGEILAFVDPIISSGDGERLELAVLMPTVA